MLLIFVAIFLAACAAPQPSIIPEQKEPPVTESRREFEIPLEFRAAWVATVANIDWPSKPGLSTAEQQAEAISLLDSAVILNLNDIVFQVRPQCDALYQSDLEPWSYFLT